MQNSSAAFSDIFVYIRHTFMVICNFQSHFSSFAKHFLWLKYKTELNFANAYIQSFYADKTLLPYEITLSSAARAVEKMGDTPDDYSILFPFYPILLRITRSNLFCGLRKIPGRET